MISVLVLTYKRPHLLEEAIESFLLQETEVVCEMVIINDNPEVDYLYNNDKIRIINHKERFSSIAAKIEWGYKQCKYDYIYRLDDDDLLTPWAIQNLYIDITKNPDFEIYRSSGHYFFTNNISNGKSSSINNGNVYTKAYLNRIDFPNRSMGEDNYMTFFHNAKIYESTLDHTMIYRWGMGTLHISGMGDQPSEVILAQADKVLDNTKGIIELKPHFKNEYYKYL